MRSSSGGWVSNMPPRLERRPLWSRSGDSMYRCAVARVTVCSGVVSSRSFASASARPSRSPVISAADASARYSRRRDSAICSSAAPIGASTIATMPMITPNGPRSLFAAAAAATRS